MKKSKKSRKPSKLFTGPQVAEEYRKIVTASPPGEAKSVKSGIPLPRFTGPCVGGPIASMNPSHSCALMIVVTVGEKIGLLDPATAYKGHTGRMGRYVYDIGPDRWNWRGWYA